MVIDNKSRPACAATVRLPPRVPTHRHPQRVATKCGHQLHASAPEHTPYCPNCIVASAKRKLERAQEELLLLQRPWNVRDGKWKRARLVYLASTHEMEKVRKKDQLRWEKERDWDDAHLQADIASIDRGWDAGSDVECSICVSTTLQEDELLHINSPPTVSEYLAWWERPYGVVCETPKTPSRSRKCCRIRSQFVPMGSPSMRRVIRERRADRLQQEQHLQQLEFRYKTEAAVRRKHQLTDDFCFGSDFWGSPISGVITRQNLQNLQSYKQMDGRRARGNKLRPRPARSSLSFYESASEMDESEVSMELLTMREETQAREREIEKVGEELGYLYCVGDVDRMEEWREEYQRSNRGLIWRNQSWDGLPQDLPVLEPDFDEYRVDAMDVGDEEL